MSVQLKTVVDDIPAHMVYMCDCGSWTNNLEEGPVPLLTSKLASHRKIIFCKQFSVRKGLIKTVTYSLGKVHKITLLKWNPFWFSRAMNKHAVIPLMFPDMWRIPQVIVDERSVYLQKF